MMFAKLDALVNVVVKPAYVAVVPFSQTVTTHTDLMVAAALADLPTTTSADLAVTTHADLETGGSDLVVPLPQSVSAAHAALVALAESIAKMGTSLVMQLDLVVQHIQLVAAALANLSATTREDMEVVTITDLVRAAADLVVRLAQSVTATLMNPAVFTESPVTRM
ncbi:hypothetical protein F442_10902 [Phytophthora nicotianae P10297]|uniref:Uncharacterized protein n=3 Tax=Phytophthora nicotianae TaxID=4792 RepID=W2Q602_PHYN3|nr:hypothetical protein PPTG_23152 [Phytophthora nicotianae INRA-310]ETN07685.1 hypothetical protein PPTG_23152 [Phytophthora nicotianae INRA-310]ETP42150.1 hypothetical protein F442_10902 [Phytophthora nicotianae P10297]